MTEKVFKLATVRPDPESVRMLEQLLEMARSGELQQFTLCGTTSDNKVLNFSNFSNGVELLGHLTHQVARVSRTMIGDD